jgi:N-acetylneuraminate synthase
MAERTLVIAEAGVNHNGSIKQALALVDVAANAGADIVKFQTFRADKLTTSRAERAAYQIENMNEAGSQQSMLRKLELSQADHHTLCRRCDERSIRFMSTAFDAESLAFLDSLHMPAIKIPSGDITCAPLLLQAARLGKPLILSTGMSSLADIEAALGVLAFGLTSAEMPSGRRDFEVAYGSDKGQAALKERVTLLHCVTQYPAPPEAANLRTMGTMAAAFGLPVGYSDHTTGVEVALAAVALGATVIEKHFTLDRGLPGPDHAASLEPDELVSLVRGIRIVEQALGQARKFPVPQEEGNRPIARRSLVAARQVQRGERFTADALDCKRPGTGVSPMEFWDVVGRHATRDYERDDLIEP